MKNIVVCSDGTGNKGGSGSSTNVFRLYKSIDLRVPNQIAFYDDGIGVSDNHYLRSFTGAFGIGFEKNVFDLYAFLARNYEPGDKIFMFGFSRGAATVRATAGMIEAVGLLKNDCEQVLTDGMFDDIKFTIQVAKAMNAYRRRVRDPDTAESFKSKKTHGTVDIEMIGVWDTVSALGFPQDTSWGIVALSNILDKVSDSIISHRFYNLQLDRNVKNAYHALAIDEERVSFSPILWDETAAKKPEHIEQVWFAGAHANVGGGYPRTGLSMISLDWMMRKASKHGLVFNAGAHESVKAAANPNGKLYNPRNGLFIYYRPGIRHIRDLCFDKARILIHESVLERIKRSDYAPILPSVFEVEATDKLNSVYHNSIDTIEDAKKYKKLANFFIGAKGWLYRIFVETTFVAWLYYLVTANVSTFPEMSLLAIYNWLPDFLANFFYYYINVEPFIGLGLLIGFGVVLVLFKITNILIKRYTKIVNRFF